VAVVVVVVVVVLLVLTTEYRLVLGSFFPQVAFLICNDRVRAVVTPEH
jgi:hypothetical protein